MRRGTSPAALLTIGVYVVGVVGVVGLVAVGGVVIGGHTGDDIAIGGPTSDGPTSDGIAGGGLAGDGVEGVGAAPDGGFALLSVGGAADRGPLQTQDPGIRGEPDLAVHVPDPTVNAGETNEVTLQISNDGEVSFGPPASRQVVTTARNVRVEADADGTPLTVDTGKTAIGSVTEDQPGEAPIAVSVPEDVEAGTYSIDVDVEYSHTFLRSGGVTQERSRTYRTSVDLEVDDDARFSIVNATTDARIGDTGTLEAEVENTGAGTASDIDVTLESSSGGLTFGEAAGDSARIGELAPGETEIVRYDVTVAPDSSVRRYALDGTVQFRNEDGLRRVDERPSVAVEPQARQRFSIDDVESDLYVGEEGDVYATVTNEGPVAARNVVIRYSDESPNLIPIEESVAVGTLDAGESTSFRLPLEIGGEAEAVERAVDVAVQYRNAELERRLYEDVELLLEVEPKRDRFLVDVREREIRSGGTVALDVEVTNNLDEPVTDVEARLFANDPLDSDDDEAFVERLDPGEATTMTFELAAASTATTKTYPISFDFRYDDARGNSQLSDTERVAITVVEGDGGFPWLLVAVGVVLVVVGGGYYYSRRER